MLLTVMYLGMATSHEEEHEEHEKKSATRRTRPRSNTNQEE